MARRRLLLATSLGVNLGLLGYFKYANFFLGELLVLGRTLGLELAPFTLSIALPVGISFYTFQTLSYSIDVYRGERRAERNPGIFALYVAFFPQLVAGPIERSTHLMPQFYREYHFEYQRVGSGIKQMLWGFFKKVVIADRLAILVNTVYNDPTQHGGLGLLIATYFFAFQIYCDFSGYSDIAIGAARVMGFDLMENFRRPYFSKSISEFWRRWHISLSTWFRDYLYIPLGGNSTTKNRWYANLFEVVLVSGLWHGANWTFVIWGGLHGFYLLFSIISAGIRERVSRALGLLSRPELQRWVQVIITFHLVLLAWVFFRANTVGDAWYILTHLFTDWRLPQGELLWGMRRADFLISLLGIAFMEVVHLGQRYGRTPPQLANQRPAVRVMAYTALVLCIVLFGKFSASQFIYFQF